MKKAIRSLQNNMPGENVIMPERYTHRTGQNFLIQNDIKGFRRKDKTHEKNRIRKTQY